MTREDCLHRARAALVAMRHVNTLLDDAIAKCEAQATRQSGTGNG